jgi:hypothetical protein
MKYNFKWLLTIILILLIASCKKNTSGANQPSKDFYIAFSYNDSNYKYETGGQYQYLRGGSQGEVYTSTGLDFGISPSTYISPLPINAGIQTVGLGFDLDEIFPGNTILWVDMGDSIFRTGARLFCSPGFNCSDGSHINIFWTLNSVVMNSSYSNQPLDSFFSIDTGKDFHHTENLNLKDYDKIITGRFQCKVFNPGDTSVSNELTNGKFRMPVWRNGYD